MAKLHQFKEKIQRERSAGELLGISSENNYGENFARDFANTQFGAEQTTDGESSSVRKMNQPR